MDLGPIDQHARKDVTSNVIVLKRPLTLVIHANATIPIIADLIPAQSGIARVLNHHTGKPVSGNIVILKRP